MGQKLISATSQFIMLILAVVHHCRSNITTWQDV